MELKKIHISDIGKIVTGKTPKTSVAENYDGDIPFLTPSDDLSHKSASKTTKTLTEQGLNEVRNSLLPPRSICVSCIGSDLGKVVMTIEPTVTNQQFNSIVPNKNFNADFVYYLMTLVGRELNYLSKTSTAVPIINKSSFSNYEIEAPDLETQKNIASILSSIDSKIELNRRVNDNLEQQAQALFNYYFIDTPELLGEFSVGSLADAANYVNGLAMQKYRPINGEKGLPVLKIKELGQGRIDSSSDFCSNEIDSYYKVYDGDVIFSWSGTLMVKIWCGGKCGLNQHLFKVSSKTTPKWFYYFWTKHHLDNFIRIAKDKAVTMGHIKREELEKAEVLFPNNSVMKKLDTLMAPFLDQIIEKECEIRKLALLRDTLLPKLMSGKLKINDMNN